MQKRSPLFVCGIPEVLYTDNGIDFTSHHLERVDGDLKIRLIFSLQGKPRGRGRIEQFFSTVNEMFLCELDGYAPVGSAVRGKAGADAGRVRCPAAVIFPGRLPSAWMFGNKGSSGRALGSQWIPTADTWFAGATGFAVNPSSQGLVFSAFSPGAPDEG
jgi:hypothetical protein